MSERRKAPITLNFRRLFFRGLTILLPSILTIWILIAAYGFVKNKIADPINAGVREFILQTSNWPIALEAQIVANERKIRADPLRHQAWEAAGSTRGWLRQDTRREILNQWWGKYPFPLDLIGLVIAVGLIYTLGAIVGSFIGNRLIRKGEKLLERIPLIKQVYPSVKQVTDTLFGGGSSDEKIRFSRVVAVEYPRKEVWSVGLVTGGTMHKIETHAGEDCLTVFIPSSPTPFTGYVITIPKKDTIDLGISIDEALKFTVSGGVIIPATEQSRTRGQRPTGVLSGGSERSL